MPKLTAAPTSSIRRRSTRSPAPPSSSSDSRSPDATAYQLLMTQLEREEWRQLSDRKGGFALVKKGHTIDDAVDGESMLIEEGFTLQKYQDLFFATMEEEELEEWTDRLPDHPKLPAKSVKKKNRVSISPSDAEEEEEEGYELIGGGSRAASSKKKDSSKAKKSANKKSTQAKNKRKRSSTDDDDLESDGDDGIPGGELRRFQKELFDTWLSGKAEFDSWNNQQEQEEQSVPKKKKSFKAMKAEVAATRTIILENKHENEKMVEFKKQKVDPVARKVKVAVDEYVQAQAAALKKDILEEMLLDNYPLSDVEEGGEDEGENGGGEEMAEEIVGDDEVDNSKGADDKPKDGSFEGKSRDEVEAATALLSTDWTSAVIEGSASNGSS